MERKIFNLNDYDVIAFDMDHTLVQYHLPELFKLIYESTVEYLVKEKHYGIFLHKDNFEKYEDFSLRGLVFDCNKGNFLKLDKDGYILRCSHGLKNMSGDYISEMYGIKRLWSQFSILKEKVYNHEGYVLLENFFLMPAALLIGEIIEEVDKVNNGVLSDYTHVWKDVAAALLLNFQPSSFKAELGMFFPSLKKDIKRYIKKCPSSVMTWIKKLKVSGKTIVLITDSYGDYAEFIMSFTFGLDWKESFDYIIVAANKPNFFQDEFKSRNFIKVHEGNLTNVEVADLQKHTLYARGHACQLERVLRSCSDSLKVVYFGDSMKSDIYPPKKFMNWDTVAVLEELEAEKVCFKNNKFNGALSAFKATSKEKQLIASTQWGSFFTDEYDNTSINNYNNNSNDVNYVINTFWADIVCRYSRLAIPLLDYIAENDLNFNYASFDVEYNSNFIMAVSYW
ncbi:5'-nucleotidase domain-containing protein 1 isoform X1 [Hydra vulgaris]|uniref:5'-nucleotidase domain-containing protein 1 isoform X1 n=1 Tax=Hydra vulgaris TaxID=6087 RepID=UPI00064101A9|nr:5'-nucleotidase domain-containing protein 1 [Hydra vulgaris]